MYNPTFVISPKILKLVSSADSAKRLVEYIELGADGQKQMATTALLHEVYYATHIEGNELTESQIEQILEGATSFAQNTDVQEIINYRRVMNIVWELSQKQEPYSANWLREIHAALVYNILPVEKAGALRTTQVVMRDPETNEIVFTPAPAIQVSASVDELMGWLNNNQELHPVIKAAVVTFMLTAIHPFVQANGLVTRLFSTLILLREGFTLENRLTLSEQIYEDYDNYLEVFLVGGFDEALSRDVTPVIEYFASIVSVVMEKLVEDTKKMSTVSRPALKIGDQVALSVRQMKILQYISENGRAVMKELKGVLPEISDDTILRDLTALTKKGIIEKEGTTKASSYILKR